MPDSLTMVHEKVQTLVEALVEQGAVCKITSDGAPLFELYSLLDCLAPDEGDLPERLRRLRFVPRQHQDLGLYLLYIPLPDVLEHLVPSSSLPEARTFHRWLSTELLPTMSQDGDADAAQRRRVRTGGKHDGLAQTHPAPALLHRLFTGLRVTPHGINAQVEEEGRSA